MVTMTQLRRLEERVDDLARRLDPERPRLTVELVWLQEDGSTVDGEGKPYVAKPGDIVLEFGTPRW